MIIKGPFTKPVREKKVDFEVLREVYSGINKEIQPTRGAHYRAPCSIVFVGLKDKESCGDVMAEARAKHAPLTVPRRCYRRRRNTATYKTPCMELGYELNDRCCLDALRHDSIRLARGCDRCERPCLIVKLMLAEGGVELDY